jgi:hypothetical protein
MKYVIEVSQGDNAFQIEMHLPLQINFCRVTNPDHTWRALEGGYIPFRGGRCGKQHRLNFFDTTTIVLHRLHEGKWYAGLWIYSMFDWMELKNGSGTGWLLKSWCGDKLSEGTVTWVMVD